jgi:hypothetical protein
MGKLLSFRRMGGVAAVAALAIVGVVSVALGDNVQINDTVTNGDVTNAAPGSSGTADVRIVANNSPPPDVPACNVDATHPATVTLSSNQAWVTFPSGNSVQITACGNAGATTIPYSISSSAPFGATATITSSTTGGLTGSKYNDDSFTISTPAAPPDTTGPVITPNVSGTLGNNGWYTSDVTVSWGVSDPDSPISSSSGCATTTITTDTAGTTLTCTATSAGGTSSESVTIKRDATAPTDVATTLDRSLPDHNGWYNAPVGWTTAGTDTMSGINSCSSGTYSGPDGTGLTVSGTCTDKAGNTSSPAASSAAFKYDNTDPTGVATTLERVSDHNGWYNAPVGWTTTGTDATSLIGSCSTGTYSGPDGTGLTVSGTCTDQAGNESGSASSAEFKYDNTDPTVSVTGVSHGATYIRGSVPSAGCNTQDNLSGVQTTASLVMSGPGMANPNGVGSFTATCSGAKDNANNSGSASATYSVIYDPAGLSGILQPINPDNTSLFSRGKAVPVKFRLAGDEPNGFNYSGWTLQRIKVLCTNFDSADAAIEAVVENPSNAFRYDAGSDQYINNASFKDQPVGTCWKVRVTLDSNQTMESAVFSLQR